MATNDTNVRIILEVKDKGASRSSKKVSTDLKAVGVAAIAATGTIIALGAAVKKTFDFAKEGAGLAQLGQSFDRMEDRLGLQIDLREELIKASRGTISTADLEASSMSLLAGASGDLEAELAKNLPQLLEIAKAANKVNPALGDTAFMFNSIATGVKRAQPLILDNLGLTLKVGEANEVMAKKLGKSVNELTAEEKTMAILNATMKAGAVLIDQAGGNVDSLADEYAILEVNIKNSTDTMKENINEALLPMVRTHNDRVEAINLMKDALEREIITEQEYITINKQLRNGTLDANEAFILIQNTIEEQTGKSRDHIEALKGTRAAYDNLGTSANVADGEMEELGETIEEMPDLDFWENADLGISGAIENAMEELEFLVAGGGGIVETFQLILDNAETLGPEMAAAMLGDSFIDAQALQVELGNITADEAAQNIRDTLGVSLSEARGFVQGVLNGLNRIDGKRVQSEIVITTRNITRNERPGGRGRNFAAGTPPGGFIVPSGFSNDSFPINVQSGETVNVTPAGQSGGGGFDMDRMEDLFDGLTVTIIDAVAQQ